jgi:hypothetical protein
LLRGFGEAYSQRTPFGSFDLLLLLESHQKLKQTGPKCLRFAFMKSISVFASYIGLMVFFCYGLFF